MIMKMREKGFTLIELMVVVVIIGILAAIAIPNFIRMRRRAQESDVKSVAHTLQLAVEDYQTSPGLEGIKPASVNNLIISGSNMIPSNVLNKRNPFSTNLKYSQGSALTDGVANIFGQVAYTDRGTEPYWVTAFGSPQSNAIILCLEEGS